MFYVTILYHKRLFCSVKNCFVSRKIVVFRKKLFCIAKDCCVPRKIVLYHERLLCIQLNIKLCFALVGHRITTNVPWEPKILISRLCHAQLISFD